MKLLIACLASLLLSVSESMLLRPSRIPQRPSHGRRVFSPLLKAHLKGKEKQTTFVDACESGNQEKALALLQGPLDVSEDLMKAFWHACMSGMTEVASKLIESHSVDPSTDNNTVLKAAIRFGNVHIVKLLLSDPRVRSVPIRQMYFTRAVFDAKEEMAVALLSHPSIDPSYGRNLALLMTVQNRMPKLFDRLMRDHRVISKPLDMARAMVEAYSEGLNAELERMASVLSEESKAKLMNESVNMALALLSLRSTDPRLVDWNSQSGFHKKLTIDHLNSEHSSDLKESLMMHFIQDFVLFKGDMTKMIDKWLPIADAFGLDSVFMELLDNDTDECTIRLIDILSQQDLEDLSARGFNFAGIESITTPQNSVSFSSSDNVDEIVLQPKKQEQVPIPEFSGDAFDEEEFDLEEEERRLKEEEAELALLEAELENQ